MDKNGPSKFLKNFSPRRPNFDNELRPSEHLLLAKNRTGCGPGDPRPKKNSLLNTDPKQLKTHRLALKWPRKRFQRSKWLQEQSMGLNCDPKYWGNPY